jgi:tetratricopeptide (TPR) repeat protein
MSAAQKLKELQADHDTDRAKAVAGLADLATEIDAEIAAAYATLVNHVIGDQEGDRAHAARLLRQVRERGVADPAGLFEAGLTVALFMAGAALDGLQVEADLVARVPHGRLAAAWIRLRCAEALIDAKDFPAAVPLAAAVLRGHGAAIAETPSPFDRPLAIACNNIATAVIEQPGDHPARAELIEHAALLSRAAWIRCGTWINHERGDYLVALAYNALGRPGEALDAARHGLGLIETHGGVPVDRAFLTIELALSLAQLGRADDAAEARQEARRLAQGFSGNAYLTDWFEGQFARLR